MPNTGNTSTLVFSGWGSYAPEILSIDPPGETVEMLSDAHLLSTGQHPKVVEDLTTIGEMNLEVRFDGEIGDLDVGEVGTATITFPLLGSDVTGPKAAGTAIITAWQPGTVDNEGRLTGTVTLQPDGLTDWAYTDGVAP